MDWIHVAQDRKHSHSLTKNNKYSYLGEKGGMLCSKTTFQQLGTVTSNMSFWKELV
jgi:hypothetical protein